MVALAAIEHEMFKIMVFGAAAVGERSKAEELIHVDRTAKILGTISYGVVYITLPVVQVFLPIGPNAGRIGLTAASSIATMVYFAHFYVAHVIMHKKIKVILGSNDVPIAEAAAANKPDGGLSGLLTRLKENVKRTKRLAIVLFVLTLVFVATPQLYAFKYVMDAIFLVLSTGKSHPLLNMSLTADKASSADDGLVTREQVRNSKTAPTSDNSKQQPQQLASPLSSKNVISGE